MRVYVDKNKFRTLPSILNGIANIGIKPNIGTTSNRLGYSRNAEDDDYSGDNMYDALEKTYDELSTTESPSQIFNYPYRKRKFHKLAGNAEIERVIKATSDEAIVYDDSNMFCSLNINTELDPELVDELNESFHNIYSLYEFDDKSTAWELWYKWMIEGYLAFEMVWDDLSNPDEIQQVIELDPDTLYPTYRYDVNGRKVKVWLQKDRKSSSFNGKERILPDTSVVFIAYNRSAGNFGKISYVERLERSFNMMRIMEDTKVAWHIINSQWRLKFVLPFSSRKSSKVKEGLAKVKARYDEKLYIDSETGLPDNGAKNPRVEGDKRLSYRSNYIFPKRDTEPNIDSIKHDGPDLSRPEMNEYFSKKFYRDSNLPSSRYDEGGGRGATSVLFQASGIPYDEIMFYRDINRLRNEFSNLLVKPLITEFIAKHPEFIEERGFKNKIGIKYNSSHLMEEAKKREIESKDLDHIQSLSRLQFPDGTPVFKISELLEKYWTGYDEELGARIKQREQSAEENASEGGGRSRW